MAPGLSAINRSSTRTAALYFYTMAYGKMRVDVLAKGAFIIYGNQEGGGIKNYTETP